MRKVADEAARIDVLVDDLVPPQAPRQRDRPG
jgi:hypothetical protein